LSPQIPFYGISENGANIQLDQYGYSSFAGKPLPGNGPPQPTWASAASLGASPVRGGNDPLDCFYIALTPP
jgi:hypothetical protein